MLPRVFLAVPMPQYASHMRAPVYKTHSAPALQHDAMMAAGSGSYAHAQHMMRSPNGTHGGVLMMPQHPYALDGCGMSIRDAAKYNSTEMQRSRVG